MSNSHLKDRSISLKAKGLLSLILSLPDGWVYTIKGLATLSSDGLDSTRAALKNLEDHGYVVRRQLYDKRGRFAKCEYTVYERPHAVFSTNGFTVIGKADNGPIRHRGMRQR